MDDPARLAEDLERAVACALTELRAVPGGPATARPNRPSGTGWSQREELGHLIDSAVNNHLRIVRATLDGAYEGPGYDQVAWIEAHRYREWEWGALVEVWHAHNRALVPLVRAVPVERLAARCEIGGDPPVPLGSLIEDYLLHMRHHLDQILRRNPVTRYPRV